MNLSTLSQSQFQDTVRLELLHPATGERLNVFIDVLSAKSDKSRQFLAQQVREAQRQEFENARSRRPKFKGLEDIQKESIDTAISRIAGWENVEWEGKAMLFTPENAQLLLKNCDWIVEQVLECSNDLGKFLKA